MALIGVHKSRTASNVQQTRTASFDEAIMTDTQENTQVGEEPIPHLHARTFLVVFSVCSVYFAQMINVVGAGAQAQTIVQVIGGNSESVWLTSVIAILTAVLSPIVSQAADYWGRRWFMVVLTVCGAVGSIVVARANNITMAIAGFTISGISFGAQPLLHAVNSEVLPRRYRPWAQGITNASCAVGGLTALLSGGAMIRNHNVEGFRNYWYMATAVYVVAAGLTLVFYNPPQRRAQVSLTNMEKLRKLDWVGYILLSIGLVLFCMGLSWSQNPYSWSDPHVSVSFAVGLLSILLLVAYETLMKKDGMLHHGLFNRGRNFPIALACVFVEGLVFFAANNYFAYEVSVLYEANSLLVGLRYGITMIVFGIAAMLAGFYCSTTKSVRWPTVVAFALMLIFFVLMAFATPDTSKKVWGYPVFLGMGLGICLCALVALAQLSTPRELIAITSGLMIGMRSLGGSVGLAIYNAILTGYLGKHLGNNVASAVMPLGLPASSLGKFIADLSAGNATALMDLPGVSPTIVKAGTIALRQTFSVAFRWIWVAAGAFTFLAGAAAACLSNPTNEFNMHIDAPAEKEADLYGEPSA